MPITIRTEITINSSPKEVSKIIFDFKRYHSWNTWVFVEGPKKGKQKKEFFRSLLGSEIVVSEKKTQFRAIITLASPTVLVWTWYEVHKCCMVHQHYFEIVSEGDKCVFKHGERYSGSLAWTRSFTTYYKKREEVFEAFNKELKMVAESKDVIEVVS